MTATAADLAALSAARINEMTAALLGQPVKRAASKADAIARYERAIAAAATVTQASPAGSPSAVEEPAPVVEEVAPAPAPAKPARVRKAAGEVAPAKAKPAKTTARKSTAATAPAPAGEPRAGSKRSTILEMIRRPGGATEAEICAALGWVAAGATIGRVLRSAGIIPRREKDQQSGRVRFFAK